ncbi:beta strand repeat-containing protein, partial [Colwellia psychrerythraea]
DNSGVLYQDNAGAGFGTSYIDSFTDIQTLIGSNANLDNFVIDSGSSIDSIDGGSDGNNSLTGRDTDNEWDISGSNSGILYQDNAGAGFGTSYVDAFSNIQSLIGSDANLDIFVMGLTGFITNIDGGSDGNNTLTARQGVVNTWGFTGLTSGSLTQFSNSELYVNNFANIKNFTGGNAGGEWADLSGTSSPVNVENYFGFTGIIGNGTDSHLVGQNGVTNSWFIDQVIDIDSATTDGLNDGTFSNSNGSLSFVNFVTLTGGTSTDNFTIANTGSFNGTMNGGLGTNTLQVKDAAINTWTVTGLGGGNVNDAATIINFTDMDNLIGGINVDNFTLDSIDDITGLIDGGAGSDKIDITGNTAQDITLGTDIARIETLNAQVGTNTLRGENATNDWNITAANTGTIDDQTTTLSFTNFINLIGGTAVDTFTLSDVALVTGLIDGGAGSDKVDITGSTAQDIILGTDITRIETLTAQIGTNTLRADNTTNDWNITAANTGTIYDQTTTLSFTNFINLVGGTGVDNFTLADI